MALSDLELLSLVERAQEAKQGTIGPEGVGIRSIEQPTADTVIITLSDGRIKELRLTAGPKGDPGEAGKPGKDGKPGPAGSPGRAGAAGVGVAGAPGRDGTSIDTAIVNADGDLLLGLTDGNVLNVGRVVGPAGATGPTGPTGLPGRAGRDGNTILSAPHAPADNEGNPGDFWIDTSSPLFDFYAKGGSGWRKLTSLRAPQTPVGGKMSAGGGGGGGNGGGALQNTATLPLANPTARKAKGLPDLSGLKSQADYNNWLYTTLEGIVAGGGGSGGIVDLSDYATIEYVDGLIAALRADLGDYAKTEYVDDEIEAAGEAAEKYTDDAIAKLPPGMKAGGTAGQVLAKKTNADYVTEWIDANGGSVTIQDTPPLNPEAGALWFDSEEDELTLYIYTGLEWVPAAPPVSLDGINATINSALVVQSNLVDAVNKGLEEQNKIKLDLEELQVTKGSVARYKITATNIGAAGRNGELYVNNAVAADVQAMSFAPFDLNGQPIKPCNVGDIIELVEAVALASVGEVCRYRILSGDSNALTVEYLSGTNNFEVDETQEVYIYPQNEAGASKDYVDEGLAGKISNAGVTNLPNDTDWKIRQHNAEGSNKTLLQVKEGELGLYNLKEPSQPHHAATKAYVDSNSGGGSGGLILNLWTYKGSKNTGNDLNDGEFGSKKMANGVLELYLAHKNSRGVIYYPSPPNSTNEYSHQITESNQGGSPMTVMHKDGRCLWYAETKKIVFNKSTGNYVLIEAIKYRAAFDLLVEGDQYMLNVAGFLSPVSGWS